MNPIQLRMKWPWRIVSVLMLIGIINIVWSGYIERGHLTIIEWFLLLTLPLTLIACIFIAVTAQARLSDFEFRLNWYIGLGPFKLHTVDWSVPWNAVNSVMLLDLGLPFRIPPEVILFSGVHNGKHVLFGLGSPLTNYKSALLHAVEQVNPSFIDPKVRKRVALYRRQLVDCAQ